MKNKRSVLRFPAFCALVLTAFLASGCVSRGNPPKPDSTQAVKDTTAAAQTTKEAVSAAEEATATSANALPELPEGVVPVTWDVSPDHLLIDTEEARTLYERIVAEDYPSMDELRASPVVSQLDALSAYYKALYGNTAEIDTPERRQLREDLKN